MPFFILKFPFLNIYQKIIILFYHIKNPFQTKDDTALTNRNTCPIVNLRTQNFILLANYIFLCFILSMKIASLNSNSPQTSFRSAFPVVHWIAETNGSYTPADMQTVRLLQGKVIRMLNKPLSKTTKPIKPQEQAIKAYMSSCDADYRHKAVARSFYKYTSDNPEKYTPVSFIITGKDVDLFNNSYGRNIGEAKGKARANGHKNSSEVDDAIRDYKYDGFAFVKADKRQIKEY